jgi:hypothetical protein
MEGLCLLRIGLKYEFIALAGLRKAALLQKSLGLL